MLAILVGFLFHSFISSSSFGIFHPFLSPPSPPPPPPLSSVEGGRRRKKKREACWAGRGIKKWATLGCCFCCNTKDTGNLPKVVAFLLLLLLVVLCCTRVEPASSLAGRCPGGSPRSTSSRPRRLATCSSNLQPVGDEEEEEEEEKSGELLDKTSVPSTVLSKLDCKPDGTFKVTSATNLRMKL